MHILSHDDANTILSCALIQENLETVIRLSIQLYQLKFVFLCQLNVP